MSAFLPQFFNSIRFKVCVLYTVILGLILMIFSTVLYLIISYYLFLDSDNQLRKKGLEALANINSYTQILDNRPGALEFAVKKTFFYNVPDFPLRIFEAGKIKNLETRWRERAEGMGLVYNYAVFLFADGKGVIKSKNLPSKLLPDLLKKMQASNRKGIVFGTARWKKVTLSTVIIPYEDPKGKINLLLVTGSQADIEGLLHSLLQAASLGIPLVLLLTSFVGFIFVHRILDPIEEIARTANQITDKDLSSRVKGKHLDSEIEYVVASFNDMIARLEKSFKHINEFSSQVAHELKTPLAIIRGEAELALNQDRSKEEYKRTLRINLEETNRMRKTVEDLLLLTRLDYQPGVFKFQSFDFVEFFQEIGEQVQLLAAEKELEVKASIPKAKVMVQADKLHLRRMLFNIVDNALKFTVPPGLIKLEVSHKKKDILITISDNGVGIPEEELPKIFQQFYHVDRTGRNEGACTGLGLSIVQSIVRMHKGTIRVTSKVNHGTSFHIVLPIAG